MIAGLYHPAPSLDDRRDTTLVPCMVLVLAVLEISLVQTRLVAQGLMLNTVWIVPGMMLAIGYRYRGLRCHSTLALMAVAKMAGMILAGSAIGGAALFTLVQTAQAVAAALVLRRIAPDGLDLGRSRSAMALFLVATLVAPPVGLGLSLLTDRLVPNMTEQARYLTLIHEPHGIVAIGTRWILPGILGMVLATPLSLGLLIDAGSGLRQALTRNRIFGHAVVALVTVAVFFSHGSTYTAFLPAALVWIGLRQGVRDVGAATLVSLIIASVAVATGNGPADMLNSAPNLRQLFLEVTYLCCYGWILPVAVALESRDRLEQELARALERKRQILGNLHEVVFRLDAAGCWSFLNPAWEVMTGQRVGDAIGHVALGLVLPEDRMATEHLLAQVVEGRIDQFQVTRRFCRSDGAVRDVEIRLRGVRDELGAYGGAMGSLRDVTDHSRYVAALEQSEQRFRMVCDTAPVGIIRFDCSGQVTYCNKRCELVLVNLTESARVQSWCDAFGEAAEPVWCTLIDVLVTPGAVYEREIAVADRCGQQRWLALSVSGEFDTGLHPVGYIAAVTDVTQARRSAADLATRTRELRLITENINDVVYRIGLDGRHLYATPSVREVLGHAPQAVVGQRMGERIHCDDRAGVLAMFRRLANGEIDQAKIAFREYPHATDGAAIWLEANSRLLRDAQGRPFEIVAALRDVTPTKTLEFELIEARARAEAATHAKTRFLANLSHEIRTPMNGVIGLADLLLAHPLDPVGRRYVETIAQSGQTMMALLNDILDIARIDAGHVQLSREPFDLYACLADCLNLMTASAMRKGLDLQQVIAPDVPQRVVGDSLRLRQVLANLIGNAVKFTANGFVRLGATRSGNQLVITVQDSGIGIAADQQARMFEEFVQADATGSGARGGSGLGLAISRRLTEAMGGTLSLQSVPDVGTILTLSLPIVEPDSKPVAVMAAVPVPVPPPGTGLRLLLAEDNLTNRMIITAMLQRLGHRVDVAGCGEDVLEMVARAEVSGQPFDGVLMDIQMPGMDGLDATRALRQRGHDALHLPVIAVTANGYAEDIAQCLDAGMQGHLVKPVRATGLAEQLDRMVALRATARSCRPEASGVSRSRSA